MKELVEVIAKALVDHPEQVEVTEKTENHTIVLCLTVAEDDMGKIIESREESPKRFVQCLRPCPQKKKSRWF
jgi:septum formation topological specificity factor MinE